MKIFYLFLSLNLMLFGSLCGMAKDSWQQKLADEIIVKAEKDGHIVRHYSSEFAFSLSADIDDEDLDESTVTSIEITAKAYEAHNDELLEYLLSHKIPLQNNFYYLIHLAIKKSSKEILKVFKKYNLFENTHNMHESWLSLAIKKGNVDIIKFCLDRLKFDVDKSNSQFLSAANNTSIVALLSRNGFASDNSNKIELPKKLEIPTYEPRPTELAPRNNVAIASILDLFTYIEANDSAKVRNILQSGMISNINVFNADGETPVTLAASKPNCDINILHLLAQFGANFDKPNWQGNTPLFIATRFNNKSTIEVLANYQEQVNTLCAEIHGGTPETPLIYAVKLGNNEVAKIIAQHPKADLNLIDPKKRTALTYACSTGNNEMIEFFLSKKNTNYENKGLALILAVRHGKINLVKQLLDNEADPNFLSEDMTALHWAVRTKNYPIAKLLLRKNDMINQENKSRALCIAITEYPSSHIIKLLLQKGAQPDSRLSNGRTPLMYCAKKGYLSIVQLLLSYEADLTLTDSCNRTALMLAAKRGHSKIVLQLLVAKKEEFLRKWLVLSQLGIDDKDDNGRTALMYASSSYCPKCIEYLLVHGASTDLKGNMGEDALLILAKLNQSSIYRKIKQICRKFIYTYNIEQKNSDKTRENSVEKLLEKDKEKESDHSNSPVNLLSVPFEKNFEINAYLSLFSVILDINKDNPNPLTEIELLLENKLDQSECSEETISWNEASHLLNCLVQQETDNIYKSCLLILQKNPKAIKHNPKEKKQSILIHAVQNNNFAAVRALAPYASPEDKKAALRYLTKQSENKGIREILLKSEDIHNTQCLIS